MLSLSKAFSFCFLLYRWVREVWLLFVKKFSRGFFILCCLYRTRRKTRGNANSHSGLEHLRRRMLSLSKAFIFCFLLYRWEREVWLLFVKKFSRGFYILCCLYRTIRKTRGNANSHSGLARPKYSFLHNNPPCDWRLVVTSDLLKFVGVLTFENVCWNDLLYSISITIKISLNELLTVPVNEKVKCIEVWKQLK